MCKMENFELVLVQVVFRHGVRTPIVSVPGLEPLWEKDVHMGNLPDTDILYEVKNISGGGKPFSDYDHVQKQKVSKGGTPYGTLTRKGQEQMLNLGKQLRELYVERIGLIKPDYDHNEVYIRTTNKQRTIDSARCVAAGMFGKRDVGKGPVMIYTVPEKDEYLYPNKVSCEKLRMWIENAFKVEQLDELEGYRDSRRYVEKELGLEDGTGNFYHIRDIIRALETHGLTVDHPRRDVFVQNREMIERHATQLLVSTQCGHPYGRDDFLQLGIGKFLQEILQRMLEVQKGRASYKLILYSVQEKSITPLMVALRIFHNKWPDFAARLTFELYTSKDKKFFVRILYEEKEVVMPNCPAYCPLNQFEEIVSRYSVKKAC